MATNKKITLLGMIGIGLTTVIGSGVWKDSLLWSNSASVFSLPAVFLAWLLMLCAGLAYAESVGMFPQGGGPYSYVGGAFGRKAGSFFGIIYLISYYMIGAILSFLTALFSLIAIGFPVNTMNLTIVTIIVVVLFTILPNITSYRTFGLAAFFWSVAKIVLVAGVFIFLFTSWTPATITVPDLAGFQGAVNSSIWALLGFEVMLIFAGETEDAEKTVPKAITIALPIFLVLYLFVSFMAAGIVGAGTLASTSSGYLLGYLAAATGIPESLIFGFAAISAAGTAYAIYAMCTKQMRILAEDDVLPKSLAGTGSGIDTPAYMTMIFGGLIAGVMVGSMDIWAESVDVFGTVGIGLVLISALLPAGLTALILRRKMPALERPFKTPLYQIVFPLAILLSIYLVALNFLNPLFFVPAMIITGIAFLIAIIIVVTKKD